MSTIEERVAALESALASMTAAEKRIVELPAASSVANDDFVALDGVANGSRRFAASNLGGKAEVMTEAEWDDLPDDKYTDNKVYVLTDAEPPESQLFEKVGSASLDTSADNLSDAINEHESDISTLNSNKITIDDVLYMNRTSATQYTIPLASLRKHREYGMALIGAWRSLFLLFFEMNSPGVAKLGDVGQGISTCTASISGDNIILTFSGTVWGGITILPL